MQNNKLALLVYILSIMWQGTTKSGLNCANYFRLRARNSNTQTHEMKNVMSKASISFIYQVVVACPFKIIRKKGKNSSHSVIEESYNQIKYILIFLAIIEITMVKINIK